MTELRTLNIGNNPKIKHVRSHVVKPLTQLQALIAHECQFEKVSFLKFLPNLNTLVLSKNIITDFSVNNVGSFAHLTKLSIGNNKLTMIPDLSTSPHLVELRINHNAITQVDDTLFSLKKLKTLDLSNNRLSNWNDIRKLSSLVTLTNLGVKGNSLPDPPESVEEIELKEDKASETMQDIMERRYRHYVLSMFQRRVGAMNKLFCQLIVLDMKRVKMKFSHDYVEGSVIPVQQQKVQQQKDQDKHKNKRDSIDQHQKIKTKRMADAISPSSSSSRTMEDADDHEQTESRLKKKQKNDQKPLPNKKSQEMNNHEEDINASKKSKKNDVMEGFLGSSSSSSINSTRDNGTSKHTEKHQPNSMNGDKPNTTSKATTATNVSTIGTAAQPSEMTTKSKTSTATSLTTVAGSGVVSIIIHDKTKSHATVATTTNGDTSNNSKSKQKGQKKDKPAIDEIDLDAVLVGRSDTLFGIGGGGNSAW